MRRLPARSAAVLALLVLAAACRQQATPGSQSAANPGAVPPDTSQMSKSPPPPPGGAAATEQHIAISNATTVGMVVTARVGNQTQQLGSIEPKQQAAFMVQAPAGTAIELSAQDSAQGHLNRAILTATDSTLRWVIR